MPTLQQHQQAWLEAGIDTREDYTAAGSGSSGVHSRSSTGYYWNGTNIASAAANELRSEETLGVYYLDNLTTGGVQSTVYKSIPKGLLSEQQRTNIVTDSTSTSYLGTGGITLSDSGVSSIISGENWIAATDNNSGPEFHSIIKSSLNTGTSGNIKCWSIFLYDPDSTQNPFRIQTADGGTVEVDTEDLTSINVISTSASVKQVGLIDYGGGVVRFFVSASVSSAYESFSVKPRGAGYYTGDGVDKFYWGGLQLEIGEFPSSYIPTSGSTATRNADSILHDYDYPVGDDGKTLGLTWSHYYPKAATNVLTTATSAAGEFEATIATDASGNLDLSVKDSGASAVTAEHTFATGDEYKSRITQLDFESDDQIGFWEDNAQVGSSAAHSIATTDILADGQFTIEGFGGRIHRLAIDDPSGQSGNQSYLALSTAFIELIAEAMGLAEVNLDSVQFSITETEAMGLAEVNLDSVQFSITETEAMGLAEVNLDSVQFSITELEAMGLAEVNLDSVQFNITETEAMGLNETPVVTVQFGVTITEALGHAETDIPAAAFLETMADSEGLTDLYSATMNLIEVASEAIGFTDAAFGGLLYLNTLAEGGNLTAALTHFYDAQPTLAENQQFQDAVAATTDFLPVVTESGTLTALVSVLFAVNDLIQEGASFSDVVAAGLLYLQTITEASGLADTTLGSLATQSLTEENTTLSEATSAILGVVTSSLEDMGLADATSVSLSFLETSSEASGFADTVLTTASYVITLTEAMGLHDRATLPRLKAYLSILVQAAPLLAVTISSAPSVEVTTETKPLLDVQVNTED